MTRAKLTSQWPPALPLPSLCRVKATQDTIRHAFFALLTRGSMQMPTRDILFPMMSYPTPPTNGSVEKAVAMAAGVHPAADRAPQPGGLGVGVDRTGRRVPVRETGCLEPPVVGAPAVGEQLASTAGKQAPRIGDTAPSCVPPPE